MTINDELIQRAELWLTWYRMRCALGEIDGSYHGGVVLLRECVAALRKDDSSFAALRTDTPASTQRNPSPIDLPAPDWLTRYATPLEGQ